MIAQSLPKIPSLPPIDKVKPLALEKVCPTCSSDNTPTAVVCINCGADIAKIRALPKQRKRDQQGEQKGQNPHETLMMGVPINKVHVPGLATAAQSLIPTKMNQPVKPMKPNRKRISDDDIQVVDENHLSNVERSANHLGL